MVEKINLNNIIPDPERQAEISMFDAISQFTDKRLRELGFEDHFKDPVTPETISWLSVRLDPRGKNTATSAPEVLVDATINDPQTGVEQSKSIFISSDEHVNKEVSFEQIAGVDTIVDGLKEDRAMGILPHLSDDLTYIVEDVPHGRSYPSLD
jgi:hypothetical protein